MALSLSIRHRLLISHLFAVVVLAGAFGAFVYATAAHQVIERLHAQVVSSASLIAQSLNPALLAKAAHDPGARAVLTKRLHDMVLANPEIGRLGVKSAAAPGVIADTATAAKAIDFDAYVPVPGDGGYHVGATLRGAAITENLYTLRLYAALAFLVCVLAALLLARHLAGRFLGRIDDLTARCRALANGEPLPPRQPGPHDELDALAHEFDAMAGRLRHAAHGREQALSAVHEANERLESRVRSRTAELEGATVQLKGEIESRVHIEALLAEAALTDPLTGLLNRRAMMEMLGQAAAQLKPGEPGLCVIVADIDYFKRVNDGYGHGVGDEVLNAVAERLRLSCDDAQQHNVARWGGEEFLILLPGVRLAAACKHAEQLRRDVAALRIGAAQLHVSLSLGVAELMAGEALYACLRRCDQALYRAKDAGRDTVVAAQGALFATMS